MAELMHEYPHQRSGPDGTLYVVQVLGDARPDGTWVGWRTFTARARGDMGSTERETTQPSHEALAYWAAGLEPVHLEGAFARAKAAAGL